MRTGILNMAMTQRWQRSILVVEQPCITNSGTLGPDRHSINARSNCKNAR